MEPTLCLKYELKCNECNEVLKRFNLVNHWDEPFFSFRMNNEKCRYCDGDNLELSRVSLPGQYSLRYF
jgi:hypothetical protein